MAKRISIQVRLTSKPTLYLNPSSPTLSSRGQRAPLGTPERERWGQTEVGRRGCSQISKVGTSAQVTSQQSLRDLISMNPSTFTAILQKTPGRDLQSYFREKETKGPRGSAPHPRLRSSRLPIRPRFLLWSPDVLSLPPTSSVRLEK